MGDGARVCVRIIVSDEAVGRFTSLDIPHSRDGGRVRGEQRVAEGAEPVHKCNMTIHVSRPSTSMGVIQQEQAYVVKTTRRMVLQLFTPEDADPLRVSVVNLGNGFHVPEKSLLRAQRH